MPPLLYFLSLCNLVIGTGAFVLSSILAPVAASLQVSVAAAGQAMTAYALSAALLAPLALIATGRWPRRRALVASMFVFGAGSVVCAMADNLALLLAGRVLMGVAAMFTAVVSGIAVAMVAPALRGRALSLVFLGISLSYVIGLPLGAWFGLRHGWQAPVLAVAAAAWLCAAIIGWWLPAQIDAPGASFVGLAVLLRQPAVLYTLGLTLLYFTAIFNVFSYVGPVLKALAPMGDLQFSLTLAMFGLSGVIGTLLGGAASDRFGAVTTLRLQIAVLASMMVLVPLTAGHYPLLVAVFVVWGIAGFGMMTPQQSRLATLSPGQAPVLLSLNSSMLYLGSACGAAIGGLAAHQVGFVQLAWVGVPFALAGLVFLQLGRMSAAPQPEGAR